MSCFVSPRTQGGVPEPVAAVARLMATFPDTWCLCGGWAVDAWAGEQTRDHGDVDIGVFQDSHRALFEHLAGWQLIAHDPNVSDDTTEPWDGRPLDLPAHVHARPDKPGLVRPPRMDGDALRSFGLDVQIGRRVWQDCVFKIEPRVSLPLRDCIRGSPWGVPALVPEALLFYKAADRRERDESDFTALLPRLSTAGRRWLREALEAVEPGHAWLGRLR